MYAVSANKQGRVKKGKTCVKLSRNFDDQLKMAAGKGKGKQKRSDSEEEVQWEGEDDFAVARAWPDGLVQDRAIVYVSLFHGVVLIVLTYALECSDTIRSMLCI